MTEPLAPVVPARQWRPSRRSAMGFRLWVGGPVPPGADAITIGRTIITRRRVASSATLENLLRHELTHVEQWHRLGYRVFLQRYVGEYLTGRRAGLAHHDAYLNISFEHEARERALGHVLPTLVSIDDVEASNMRTNAFIASLSPNQFERPSLLPTWTVGHVVAHLAANAEAFAGVLDAARQQRPALLYESVDQRTNDIDKLRRLPADELTDRLVDANKIFVDAWRKTSHAMAANSVWSRVPGSEPFPIADIIHRRLREVEVHSADIGSRLYTYESWSPAFVTHELHSQWQEVTSRIGEPLHLVDEAGIHHTTPGGVRIPAVHATRRSIVAWLLSRHQPSGFPAIEQW